MPTLPPTGANLPPPPLPGTTGTQPTPSQRSATEAVWNAPTPMDFAAKAASLFAFLARHPEVVDIWVKESQAGTLQT